MAVDDPSRNPARAKCIATLGGEEYALALSLEPFADELLVLASAEGPFAGGAVRRRMPPPPRRLFIFGDEEEGAEARPQRRRLVRGGGLDSR